MMRDLLGADEMLYVIRRAKSVQVEDEVTGPALLLFFSHASALVIQRIRFKRIRRLHRSYTLPRTCQYINKAYQCSPFEVFSYPNNREAGMP